MTAKKELSAKQRLVDAIKKNNSFILFCGNSFDPDRFSAMAALSGVLDRAGKSSICVVPFDVPENFYQTRDSIKKIENTVASSRPATIRIKKPANEIGKIKYIKNDFGGVDLLLEAKNYFKDGDISVIFQGDTADAAILVGMDDLSGHDLSSYKNTISISNKKLKRDFADIDFCDTLATSLSEMIPAIAESLDRGLLDSEIARVLYSGLSSTTDFFQNNKTTPKLLTVAAQLLAIKNKKSDNAIELVAPLEKKDDKDIKKESNNNPPSTHQKKIPVADVPELNEDELYAPALSDIDHPEPVISEGSSSKGSSLLSGLLLSKDSKGGSDINFNDLERSVQLSGKDKSTIEEDGLADYY